MMCIKAVYSAWHSQQGMSSPGKKSHHPQQFLFFFQYLSFFLIPRSRRQRISENQIRWHPGPQAHGKPPYIMLHWNKVGPFLPTSWLHKMLVWNCRLNRWASPTTCDSGKIIQCNPWTDWTPSSKTEKHREWTLISQWQWKWWWNSEHPAGADSLTSPRNSN
jgi:hypothetical protein